MWYILLACTCMVACYIYCQQAEDSFDLQPVAHKSLYAYWPGYVETHDDMLLQDHVTDMRDVAKAMRVRDRLSSYIELSNDHNQTAALVCLCTDIGIDEFINSELWIEGLYSEDAHYNWILWCKSGGHEVMRLIKRREVEWVLFDASRSDNRSNLDVLVPRHPP